MYTSGTTGDPKGVVIKNEAFMAEVLSVDHIIMLTDRVVRTIFLEISFMLYSLYYCKHCQANLSLAAMLINVTMIMM